MTDHFNVLAPLYDRLIRPPDPARLRALLDLPTTGWVLEPAAALDGLPRSCAR